MIGGDDHLYERFLPQNPNGALDPAYGITQFTVGTGGYLLYGFQPTPQPNSAARINDAHGVLKLVLHPTGYDWEFLPIPGKTSTDSGGRELPRPRRPPPPLPPAAHAAAAPGARPGPYRPRSGRHAARLLAARRGERDDAVATSSASLPARYLRASRSVSPAR